MPSQAAGTIKQFGVQQMTTTPNEDLVMLDLARRWMPYGAVPASEIWIQFGMGPDRYYAHIRRILSSIGAKPLSPYERSYLERLALDRQVGRTAISASRQDH